MRSRGLKPAVVFSLLALPLPACQTNTGAGFATGAAGGALIGAMVGGPVGAAVGGVAGAAAGGVITAEEARRVRTYVAAQQRPSVGVSEQVALGQPVPGRCQGSIRFRQAWVCAILMLYDCKRPHRAG